MTSIASPEISPNVASSETTIRLPVVKHGIENKSVLSFTLENTNVSIANALRRVLLSDIESVVFDTDNDKINIHENTTRFHNEILKQANTIKSWGSNIFVKIPYYNSKGKSNLNLIKITVGRVGRDRGKE
jgi:hypothetical protein